MPDLIPNDLDLLLDQQKAAWTGGGRPRAEDFLAGRPLPADKDLLLDLLYHEIVLREELGESPALDDYSQRYPHLAEELRLHFEVHAALHAGLLNDTRELRNGGAILDAARAALEIGPDLPDYDTIALIGQGGMGVVYRARHRRLRRLVALKMFKPGRLPSPRELARFQTEAEAIARLQHPNIVQIFEVGQSRGLPFLALELAEGGTLAQKLQHLPLSPRAAAELVRTLAVAVQHAHAHQIVHRDLKPANVLFAGDGTPKITDFGLAKMLEEPADAPRDATYTGEPLGTPRYMAPEQAAGRPDQIGPATDVYALGTILYECLTGQAPFMTPSTVGTLEKIRTEEPRSPRRLQPAVARDLETICLKCLHKQPGRRYASAQDLADDLGCFLRREPIRARPTPAWEHAWMWCRRHPSLAVLAAAALLAICGGVVAYGVRQYQERQRIDRLRAEVAGLMRDGREASESHDNAKAQECFRKALTLVLAEPALRDQDLGVAGWLNHTFRQADLEHRQMRRPPPELDELRDEALVQCFLLDPEQKSAAAAARRSIQAARELADADPASGVEREQLALLEAALSLREDDANAALATLDRTQGVKSRLWLRQRAECLDRLGRAAEAEQTRRRADQLAPQDTLAFFYSGMDRLYQRDVDGAIRDFEQVLEREPDHFMARLFQAVCFQRRKRLGEAKVALTACAGQRPWFAWTYLLRGQVEVELHAPEAALADFQRGLDAKPREAAHVALLASRGFLHLQCGRGKLALDDFDQALALAPDAPDARRGRERAVRLTESVPEQR